jgi:hypothetical protein
LTANNDVQRLAGLNRNDGVNAAATAKVVVVAPGTACVCRSGSAKRDHRELRHTGWHLERLFSAGVMERLVIRQGFARTVHGGHRVSGLTAASGEQCRSSANAKRAAVEI